MRVALGTHCLRQFHSLVCQRAPGAITTPVTFAHGVRKTGHDVRRHWVAVAQKDDGDRPRRSLAANAAEVETATITSTGVSTNSRDEPRQTGRTCHAHSASQRRGSDLRSSRDSRIGAVRRSGRRGRRTGLARRDEAARGGECGQQAVRPTDSAWPNRQQPAPEPTYRRCTRSPCLRRNGACGRRGSPASFSTPRSKNWQRIRGPPASPSEHLASKAPTATPVYY